MFGCVPVSLSRASEGVREGGMAKIWCFWHRRLDRLAYLKRMYSSGDLEGFDVKYDAGRHTD